jgi:putative hydrolase of the HAD superfamily
VAPERAALTEAIAGRFLADCRAAFARNKPVLARLKKRYRLGIVSNFYGNLSDILAGEGLSEYFDVVADSAKVGHLKPSAEIFLHATAALGAKPDECLMVGDSVPRDMKGAEGLSMPHALITQNGKSCCDAVWRVANLTELEARLS